jgi:hypothetical protein
MLISYLKADSISNTQYKGYKTSSIGNGPETILYLKLEEKEATEKKSYEISFSKGKIQTIKFFGNF